MGISFRFDAGAIDQIAAAIRTTADKMLEGAIDATDELAQMGVAAAREHVPVAEGLLRESIHSWVDFPQHFRIRGNWGTNVEYAPYVEFGTGPTGEAHKPPGAAETGIRYKQTKWKVNIPGVGVRYISGMRAQPYMYPSFQEVAPKVTETVVKCIRRRIGQ